MAERKPTPDILGQQVDIMGDVLSAKPVTGQTKEQIPLHKIRTDGGTQMRAGLDDSTVFEYTQAMIAADGWGTFPPAVVIYDGSTYWVGDGFHRLAAFRDAFPDAQQRTVPCEVRAGSRRDAVLYAAGANASHGLRRTPADKRRAVETLLRDNEWVQWSDREIGRACNVSHEFVRQMRAVTVNVDSEKSTERTYTTKHGTTATMQTANIGQRSTSANTFDSAVPVPSVVASAATGSRQHGAEIARCRICNRPLSDPASAVAGVGPCCANKRLMAVFGGEEQPEPEPEQSAGKRLVDWTDEDWDAAAKRRQENYVLTPDRSTPAPSMAVHFSSETAEHYTPRKIIDAVIACMGGIDLDPCSNSKDAPNVPAADHYTREDDGLAQKWFGHVYMNPPYGREIDDWVAKLVSEYESGHVTEAIALVPSRTDTQWWERLRNYHVCLVSGRLKFIGNNDSAPFPSAVFYLGRDIESFVHAFEELGDIWHRVGATL